mgnify:FL=1|tara:strand:- start:2017 stop:3168 length:1152 start_codon:yes stop_codon:yes gene_type:complete
MSAYIINALRTPIGSFGGQLACFRAPELGAKVIKSLIEDINLDLNSYDQVIMGNVLSAGLGQAPARQATILGGLNVSTECLTINKMCGSGLKAVMIADNEIKSGSADMILAGGMESMSNAPLLVNKNLSKIGHGKMVDSMVHDGLWDAYNEMHMGSCAELLASERNYSRILQDNYAVKSYEKAQNAISEGLFSDEIISVNDDGMMIYDEEPGRAKFEKIPLLKPAFEKNGTITAANASKLNDGAAALLLASERKVKKYNIKPIAKIIAHCSFAHDPKWFTTAPSRAIEKVLNMSGLSKNDIDIWEINEAFAAVAMAAIEDFNIDETKVNIHGGAVALGHPIGASGARILTTLLNVLKLSNKQFGLATLCIGGGEASAMIVERV